MLLSYSQRGRMDPLVDLLSFPCLESVQALPTVTHPASLEGEACSVSSVSAQRTKRPGYQLGARVVNVPQVDVFMCDLHHTLTVDVQIWAGQQEHIKTLCVFTLNSSGQEVWLSKTNVIQTRPQALDRQGLKPLLSLQL